MGKDTFVHNLEIVRVIACLADPNKIRFTANFDRDVAETFPYLNAILPGAIYNHPGKTLTLHRDGRLLTIYALKVEAAKIENRDDAQDVVRWIVGLINECHRKRATIKPNFERRERLGVIDIVKLLPGTNCKRCGQPTCLAFAAFLAAERVSIMICTDIFLSDYSERRKELITLLKASGYSVPESFV